MNHYSTVHDVTRINVVSRPLGDGNASWITKVSFLDAEGGRVEITAFSSRPITIEGAEDINHISRETASLIEVEQPDEEPML